MATYDPNARASRTGQTNGRDQIRFEDENERLGDLLRRFAQDAGTLVRQEIALAKLELRENVKEYARDASKVGIAAAIGVMAAFALMAFAIIGLGALLDNYWLAALIVGVMLLITAGVMARGAIRHMRRNSVAPDQTVETLKEDTRWMKHEARDMKRRLKA
jgi:uncharacterized membrane protein YqjE